MEPWANLEAGEGERGTEYRMDSPLQQGLAQTRTSLWGLAAGISSHQRRCYFKGWSETSTAEPVQTPQSPESGHALPAAGLRRLDFEKSGVLPVCGTSSSCFQGSQSWAPFT